MAGNRVILGVSNSECRPSGARGRASFRPGQTGIGALMTVVVMMVAAAVMLSFSIASVPSQKARVMVPDVPFVVYGYTCDEAGVILPSCSIKVLNQESGNSSLLTSDTGGWYQLDLNDISGGYDPGDRITLLGSSALVIGVNRTSVGGGGGAWLNLTLSEHTPIRIEGNGDFDAMHAVYSGSGTALDPYILEAREISGENYGYCIYIGNTTAHFTVRDCELHHATNNSAFPWKDNVGLTLYNVSNGLVRDNLLHSSYRSGVFVGESDNCVIANNTALDNGAGLPSNGAGVLLIGTSYSEVSNNSCTQGSRGVQLKTSSHNLVVDNNCTNNTYAIHLYPNCDWNTVANNNCSSCGDRGIYVSTSVNNTITYNNCSSNVQYGIYLYQASNNTVSDNLCNLNGKYGFYMNTKCFDNNISYNDISGNLQGMNFLSSVTRNLLFNNSFVCNTGPAVNITQSAAANNRFWNNTFIDNNGAGGVYDVLHLQARDLGTNNWWNTTDGWGNLWSDWTYPDVDGDGIVDVPYVFTSNQDNYPLTTNEWRCTFTAHLSAGWNFLTVPLTDLMYNASTLGLSAGDVVARWNSTARSYDGVYVIGLPVSDFEIQQGIAYFVYVSVAKDLVLAGSDPEKYSSYSTSLNVPTGGGWVNIGLTSLDDTRHASDVASFVSGAHAQLLAKWNSATQRYQIYVVGYSPPAYDFDVLAGDGLWMWVDATGGSLVYAP